MIKNYLKIAIRNLQRHRLFSFINLLCLALGITFSLLIGMYILHEKRVNTSLRHVSNQYFLKSKWKVKDMGLGITTVAPLPKTMQEEFPDLVANYYRYNPVTNVVTAGDKHFKEDIAIGDTTLVTMYGFPVLYGNPQHAFKDDNSVVITESMAKKLFGKSNALNERLSVQTTINNEKQDYLVSAVLKDIPFNTATSILGTSYEIFVPTIGNRYYQGGDPAQNWNSLYEVCLMELKEGVTPADVRKPITQTLRKYTPENIYANLDIELAPVKDYYLNDNNGAVLKMILALSLIAVFILVMAIINFININIGTSAYRLKEIGLRKVFGSERKQLISQFLAESMVLTLLAGFLAICFYEALRPFFNQLLNTSLTRFFDFTWLQVTLFLALVLVTGLLAGIYPAFVLSAAQVIHSVKGKMETAKGGLLLRKSLLVIQFTLAIIVFIATVHVTKQVSYVFNKDLGYDKEQLLVITAFPKQWDTTGVARMESIKKGLLQLPQVKAATVAFEVPERKPPGSIPMLPVNGDGNQPVNIPSINADEDYAATFGLEMKSGHFFNHGNRSFVPGQLVLNESAALSLGIDPAKAEGQQVQVAGSNITLTVTGIVKDYNYSNVQEGIEPMAFVHVQEAIAYRYLAVKLSSGAIGPSLEAVNTAWKKLSPQAPFEYFFMDDKFQSLYQSELQLKKATQLATILNFIIVFLGIFGVVAFTLVKRNKEIAVRKVLGAEAAGIIKLFIKDYGLLIVLANILAWPVAYLIINHWLQNYSYRIQQSVGLYAIVAVLVTVGAFVMITAQCFKTAVSNPVKSLRTE